MTRKLAVILVSCLVPSPAAVSVATAEPVGFVASLADHMSLFEVDLGSGAGVPVPGFGGVFEVAYHPNGTLYGVLLVDSQHSSLVTLDPPPGRSKWWRRSPPRPGSPRG